MATRVISTSIKLEGEAAFKKQLSEVNSNLKTMDSQMKLVTEEFKGQANSAEALTAKQKVLTDEIEQQREKVRALEKALEESADAYGENDKRVDGYEQSLNRAKAQLVKMQRELDETNGYLKEAESNADHAASSIDGFGRSAKKAENQSGGFGSGVKDLAGSLGKLKGLLVGGAIVKGTEELASTILDIEESTREYRQIIGTLEVSSVRARYSAEQTADAYERLHGYLGDTQTAATTVANLQAIGLSQEYLMELVDATAGAWSTYGDSIPIDGLSGSINETIQAGKVTGTFADVLNWAGTNEDEFNEKLEAAKSSTERANIVLEEMAKQGLADAGRAWRDVNSDIVEANEAQAEWDKALGELGEALVPAANALRRWGAEALGYVTEMVRNAISALQDLSTAMGSFFSGGSDAKSANMVVDETDYALQQAQTYKTTQQLATAGIQEQSWDSAVVQQAAAQVVNGVNAGTAANSGGASYVKTTINIDSRAVAESITPALRETDKSNPEVKSDR